MRNEKVLIVGIDSFTGKHLYNELNDCGYQVYGTARLETKDGRWYQCDILDKARIKEIIDIVKPDYIVHLVAISFVQHINKADIYNINIVGVVNLLEAVHELGLPLKKIVLPSSATVYEPTINVPIDESVGLIGLSDYAVSKISMEMVAKLWFERLPIIVTRPFNYTGVGQAKSFIVPKIVDHFKRGEKTIELGNIDVYRDISDVADVVYSYRRLLESPEAGVAVNICSGRCVSIRQIISDMEALAGYSINVVTNPDFVRKNDIERIVGCNKKLLGMLGEYEFSPMAQLIKKMYEID